MVYRIEPQGVLRQLRMTLHALPLFSGVELRREAIPAHMTIAEFLTVTASEQLASQLNGTVAEGTWECREVENAIPNLDFAFQRVATFRLAA